LLLNVHNIKDNKILIRLFLHLHLFHCRFNWAENLLDWTSLRPYKVRQSGWLWYPADYQWINETVWDCSTQQWHLFHWIKQQIIQAI